MALTKVITDVLDDSIRIGSGSLNVISGSKISTGSFGRLQTHQANALLGSRTVTLGGDLTTGGALTTAGTLTTQNNNVTINAVGAARTLTLNESLTVGDGNDGTITFSGASKTLTVEDTSLVNQDLTSDASPTFAAGTITGNLSVGGTLTAQEIHTEFTSASIMFSSGSTIFGDTPDDVHEMTGSVNISGSLTLGDGTFTVTDTTNLNDVVTITSTGVNAAPSLAIDNTSNSSFIHSAEILAANLGAGNNNIMLIGKTGATKKSGFLGYKLNVDSASDNNLLVFGHFGTTELMALNGAGDVSIGSGSLATVFDPHSYGGTTLTVASEADANIGNISIASSQNTDDGDALGDLIFSNTGDSSSEKRQVIIRGLIDGGSANARGGRLQISTKQADSTSFTVGMIINNEGTIQNGSTTGFASMFPAANNSNFVSYGFVGDQNTGMFRAAADTLAFGTGGSERVRITSAGDVGIGTNSPDAGLDLRDTMKLQTNTVPASLIVGTNDTTDHTGQDSALAIDFRNLSTTTGGAGGLVGLDKDGLELSKILLVTDNHDANTSSIRMFTSTNAAQRTQMMNINNDGVTVGGGSSAQRALHVQGTTGLCLSDGDRDRAALLPVSPDADTGHMQFNTRSGGASRERMRLTSTGNLCVGPSGSSAGFTPALTVTGTNPSLGLRLQDGNSGTFFNTILSADGNSIKAFYSQAYSLATAANDGGTSENSRFTLDTSGNISIDGNLTEGSDIRLKTNIEKIPDVLDALDKIEPVKFEWKEDVEEGIEKKHIGLIAQEVEPHFPELIYEGTTRDTEETTYKGLNYAGLTPILLKSIQELSSKVNELQQKIEELEK